MNEGAKLFASLKNEKADITSASKLVFIDYFASFFYLRVKNGFHVFTPQVVNYQIRMAATEEAFEVFHSILLEKYCIITIAHKEGKSSCFNELWKRSKLF